MSKLANLIAEMIANPKHYGTCGPDCVCRELRELPQIRKALKQREEQADA